MEDGLPTATRQGAESRASLASNLPPNLGEGRRAQVREARVQELLGRLRRPVGVERPLPHRPALQPHAHL